MVKRVLQWAGLVAIVGLAGFGGAALALVKDRISVTIQEGDPGLQTDPLALVRDELGQVHVDLQAIAEGLSSNLQRVGQALDEQSQADREQQLATQQRFEELQTALAALQEELGTLRTGLATVAARPVGLEPGTGSDETPEEATPVGAESVAAAELLAADTPVTTEADAAQIEETAPEAQPEPKRQTFLSFTLPSNSFAFDRDQHYRVVPSLSRVGFDAKSTLHDFTGVTSQVRGEIDANLADPAGRWSGSIRCTAASLRTGVEGRDEGMWEHLGTEEHADIVFEVSGFSPDPEGLDLEARTVRGKVAGTMTIRGVTREVSMPVNVSVDDSKRVVVSGQMPLRMTDYDVEVPSQIGLISVEDTVKVWVELRARSTGAATKRDDH